MITAAKGGLCSREYDESRNLLIKRLIPFCLNVMMMSELRPPAQGQQGFTPEYVIKNQTKLHLRNYSFLHSHFLTSSQTKLLIPWTFFNVQYIIRYSEDSRKAMSRRRHRGFGSLHATALASKMRQQSDWTGKNYLFNIDCRWLADWAMSAYISKPIYLVFLRDYQ